MAQKLKTFKIFTLGCKANQYDSQVMREQLEQAGLRELGNGRRADCYIINTCTVTRSADSQSRHLIRSAHRENPRARLVVTGCYAHLNADAIWAIEGVDTVINNDDKYAVCKHLVPRLKDYPPVQDFTISGFEGHTRAFVKVQDGCDNFCSFCKVPYVRGRSRSRPLNIIEGEVKKLSQKGYKEIVLTGICLGDYGKQFTPKRDIVELIEALEKIEGVVRIRLSSIEARDISDRLIQKMQSSKKVCAHLHIPFQSGDGRILQAMNRRDTPRSYLQLVHTLKRSIPDIGISADIMVGFPGEGEEEFQSTVDFLKEVEPMRVHLFTFTPRDATKLSQVNTHHACHEVKQRYLALTELTQKLSIAFKQRFNNQTLEVLFEERKNGFWRGKTRNYLPVLVKNEGRDLTNTLAQATIEKITHLQVYAQLKSVQSGGGLGIPKMEKNT